MTQVLLDEAPEFRVSMVETAASALVVAADESFDVGVIDTDARAAEAMVTAIGQAHPLLPLVVVTDAECGPPALFEAGAQDHLCRTDLTAAALVRACRHAVVRQAAAVRARATRAEGASGPALPEVLLAATSGKPPERLLSIAARLLESEPLGSVTLDRLRVEAQLDEGDLRRAKRPLGNVFLQLVTRDLAAEADLVSSCFQAATGTTGSLAEAVLFAVRTLAGFWRQAPASITLAADYTGLDERLRDLRADHLMRLSDDAISLLHNHRDEVAHEDPDRALTVAVDQLLAVLDHQRLLGALHPSTATPDEVIGEFAGQVTVFLAGPTSLRAPARGPEAVTEPAPQPAVAPEPAPEPAPLVVAGPEPGLTARTAPAPEPVVLAEPEPAVIAQPAPTAEPGLTARPAPEPVSDPAPAPEPVVLAAPEDEEARVAAALARLSAARTADRPPERPRPTEDPFVTAATEPPAAASSAAASSAEPPQAAAEPTTAAPAKTSLFARSASRTTTGAPTFDMDRIVVEGADAPRPTTRRNRPSDDGTPPPARRPSRPAAPPGRPTFDMDRIVVHGARASVA